jgi:hypothetical protein
MFKEEDEKADGNMFKEEDEKADGNSTVTDDLDQPQVISVNSQSHLNMILKAVYQSWDEYNVGLNEATKNKHHLKVRDSSTIVAYNSKQSSKTKLPLAWEKYREVRVCTHGVPMRHRPTTSQDWVSFSYVLLVTIFS